MRYLLDADWAIYVLAGRTEPATLLEQFIRTDGVGMSWVTVGELYEGAFGSSDAQGELAIYRRFLRPITLLNLDDHTVERFAEFDHLCKLRRGFFSRGLASYALRGSRCARGVEHA